jgi:TRAP-type C4-dicarboxylate transport system permease small subunit
MIWMVCIGSVLAYVRSEHLGLDILVKMVPDRVSKIVVFVGNLFILFITGLMTVGGYQVVLGAFESVSPAMRICLGYVYIIVPICSAILCLITLHRVVSQAMRLLSRKEEGKEGLLW